MARRLWLRLGFAKHLPCMRKRFVAHTDATEHAGDFGNAGGFVEWFDDRGRGRFGTRLAHPQLRMPLRCDLRKMGHAQHLPLAAESAQFLADHFGDGTTDPTVDLVEHHRADCIQTERGDLDRETNSR